MTMLDFERSDQGFTDHSRLVARLDAIRRHVREADAAGVLAPGARAELRPRFVELWGRCQALGQFNLGRALALDRGEQISHWGSYLKLLWSELLQDVTAFGLDVVGAGCAGHRDWAHDYLAARAATIYSGTSEIQRNVIGERILGLPR
ncbi:hypothetical protein FSW04_05285 [Baekduia soli]|uniref:Acyl-CoA dehydrogenase/oxidase C-terminal domain-containing protein n=1 Tax=Baekduia soli TaxID=496014 RepID=A0A5B8U234_9ACTN|nr:acyl-CoA dehydrogenase family protein [Baekduia soli]QEC47057.1 hypothetical protein FSW04_05285 [Baekduia soli]